MSGVTETDGKRIRIILGPTPLPVDNISIDKEIFDVKILRKNKENELTRENYIYYDKSTINNNKQFCPDDIFNRLIKDCVNDQICQYLAERERDSVFEGSFLASNKIVEYVFYIHHIYKTTCPDYIIFHNYPHELFTYLFLKAARHHNSTAIMVHFSALPWRMCISYFSDDLSLIRIKNSENKIDGNINEALKYYESLLASHDEAMPIGDKILKNKSGNSFIYIKNELSGILKGHIFSNILRIFLKIKCYGALKKSIEKMPDCPYIVFFLHYQPEESTLPRGRIFAQQLLAIIKLRSIVPDNINLVIKEHPSMFRYEHTLAMSVRNISFYKNINKLKNTYLVAQAMDTFNLIDNSIAVATITGTVGVEALARGKQVICFGESYFKHFSGVICIEDMDESGIDFSQIKEHDSEKTKSDLINELQYKFGEESPDDFGDEAQKNASLLAYNYIFSSFHEVSSIINADKHN